MKRAGDSADLALAIVAVAVLAIVAIACGGRLGIPWDGILPFLAIGGLLLVASASIDVVRIARGKLALDAFAARQRRAIRLWSPFAIVYLVYRALRGALPLLVAHGHEDTLRSLDVALLGSSPAWSLSAIQTPWLTELLAYAYATMFFLPLAVMLRLYAGDHDRELRRTAISLQLAFYLGFAIFLLVPARSPDVVYAFPTPLVGGRFFDASMSAWRHLQAVTFDAFPSMHTAISTIALISTWRYRRLLSPRAPWLPVAVMAIVVGLLQFATLYLRQHYFVDLCAGWAVAIVAVSATRAWIR